MATVSSSVGGVNVSIITKPTYGCGDFGFTDPMEREMLEDAYKAVSVNEAWAEMAKDPGEAGFMFSTPTPLMTKVQASINYNGHSGSSFGWTMRVMQKIAKIGWNAFVDWKSQGAAQGSAEGLAPKAP